MSQRAIKGDSAQKPADPTKVNYKFSDWYLDRALTQSWDFDDKIPGNMVLYAKWTQGTISFISNGGSTVPDVKVGLYTFIPEPTVPTRAIYTFKG